MEKIFDCLDSADRARMAQTCATWRRIVYRKSVWANELIYYEKTLLMYPNAPRGARHHGSYNIVCFLDWLNKVGFNSKCGIVGMSKIKDETEFYTVAHNYWLKSEYRCYIIDHHHHLSDLLIAPLLEDLPYCEKARIYHRLKKYEAIHIKNPYATFLSKQALCIERSIIGCEGKTLIPYIPVTTEDTTDPLQKQYRETRAILEKRISYIEQKCNVYIEVLKAASSALTRLGIAEFVHNDSWYKSSCERIWSIAGFSYVT
jgi:hypothetical protein